MGEKDIALSVDAVGHRVCETSDAKIFSGEPSWSVNSIYRMIKHLTHPVERSTPHLLVERGRGGERVKRSNREKEGRLVVARGMGDIGWDRRNGRSIPPLKLFLLFPSLFFLSFSFFPFFFSFIFISETDRVPVQIAFRPAYLAVAPRAHIFN